MTSLLESGVHYIERGKGFDHLLSWSVDDLALGTLRVVVSNVPTLRDQ